LSSIRVAGWSLQHRYYSNNKEQNDQCGNSTA